MNARVKVLLGILGLLLMVGAWRGSMHLGMTQKFLMAFGQDVTPPDTGEPFNPSDWTWRNEEHWAVDQMVRDATEMLLFAAKENPEVYELQVAPGLAEHRYAISLKGPKFPMPLTGTLILQDHLWNPANLRDWVRQAASGLGLARSRNAPSRDALLDFLLTPTPQEIERMQSAVSLELMRAPASPLAHERAAALLATFALLDPPGAFGDNRFVLCRLSAHLALAEGFRAEDSPPGPSAQFASIALSISTGQTRRAVQAIEQAQGSGIPAPWLRSLSMFAKRDWRPVDDPARATLAERLASYRSRCYRQSAQEAWDWIQKTGANRPSYAAYLARIALSNSFSVEMGHELTPGVLDLELKDLHEVYALRNHGERPSESKLCAVLNVPPGRAYSHSTHTLQVIDWGIWARHFQAALLTDMIATIDFYEDKWGVKDTGAEYLDSIAARFGRLELFPLLQKRYSYARPAAYPSAILKIAALARTNPERIPDSGFVCAQTSVPYGPCPIGLPKYKDWLSIPAPFGTAYNLDWRAWEMAEMKPLRKSGLERFHELDPYDAWLTKQCLMIRFPNGKPTPEAVEEVFAESKEVEGRRYLDWMVTALGDDDPRAIEFQRQLAQLDASEYFSLGNLLKRLKREPEAAEAYLKGFKECKDRVQASNGMEWTVPYLLRTGRTQEAEAIAQECAEVYSARGLETMAAMREQQGRLEEAEDWYRKIEERYDDSGARIGFYQRHQPAYKTRLDAVLHSVFPNGLRRFDPSGQPPHPKRGVTFAYLTPLMSKWGVTQQAIIVALDGYTVENQKQYFTVRGFTKDEHMSLVVFQNGSYRTLDVNLPDRRFGVDMVDFAGS